MQVELLEHTVLINFNYTYSLADDNSCPLVYVLLFLW